MRAESGIARYPDRSGVAIAVDGVRLAYDVYGGGPTTIVLLPSTPIIHSRQWKGQIHYLSRHFRVVAYDGRGNGRSDRPTTPASYADDLVTDDVLAVMDASGTHRAVLVGLCSDGVWRAIRVAAARPDRVLGIVAFAVGVPHLSPPHPFRVQYDFEAELDTDVGWAKVNQHYWRRDYAGFARWFFEEITTEPHSTKPIDDAVGWALDGSVDAMLADAAAPFDLDRRRVEEICRGVRCPTVLVHGTDDRCQPLDRARALADLIDASLVIVDGANHMIPGRHPVLANRLIHDFVRTVEESTP